MGSRRHGLTMALLAFFEEKTWCIGAIAGGRAFVRGRSSVGWGGNPDGGMEVLTRLAAGSRSRQRDT